MKQITKERVQQRCTEEKVQYEMLVTSDGREFNMSDKDRAERWQLRLDKTEITKALINYTPVDIQECDHYGCSEFDSAFVFDWKKEYKVSLSDLTQLRIPHPMEDGRYVSIEWRDEGSDGAPYYSGFIGTLSSYFSYLDEKRKGIVEIQYQLYDLGARELKYTPHDAGDSGSN